MIHCNLRLCRLFTAHYKQNWIFLPLPLLVYLRSFLEDGTHTNTQPSLPFSPLLFLILIDLSVSTLGCPEWMRNLLATVNKLNSHRPRAQVGLSKAHRQQIQIFWLASKISLFMFPPRADKNPSFVDVSWFLRAPLVGIEDKSVDPF